MIPANAITIRSEIMPGATLMADPTVPVAPTEPTVNKTGHQTIDVGIPVEEHPELFLSRSMPTRGDGKIAVFLIDFPDYRNENAAATVDYYDGLYFSGGVLTNWGDATGNVTVSSYFKEQSFGKLNLSGKVFDWYTAKHERSYYDYRKAELISEVAEYYMKQGVDFSQFDGDSDGVLDSIVYHFAGEYSDNRKDPWYDGVTYSAATGSFGKIGNLEFSTMVQVYDGATPNRNKMIGTVCHELLHVLGMPDLYSEVYFGLTPTDDLMANEQNNINPYLKMLLGWIDKVQVITGDTDDIALRICRDTGDVAIVTDQYNGLFDEFYLVAYKNHRLSHTTIWHIDARTTVDGKSFLFNNISYDPRPDKDNPHREKTYSTYMFIEELSGNPKYDFVFNLADSPDVTTFGKDSILGPDSMPSSDMHDGRYTGIRIDGFADHKETYATFDVSFVKDITAPVVATQQQELELQDTVQIRFNEHIYQGTNWNQIQVTDLAGNPINALILRPNYPCNVIEISFADDAYLNGYKLLMPKDSVRDSSGNGLEAVVLTASSDQYFFPTGQVQLPGTGNNVRDNASAYFFPREDGLVVITPLWTNSVYGTKVEFMLLDNSGNVRLQKIVDNPVTDSTIVCVWEAGDGSFVILCGETVASGNRLFCIDINGNVKWTNVTYYSVGNSFLTASCLKYDTGLILNFRSQYPKTTYELMYINAETGKIGKFECRLGNELLDQKVINLKNGKFLRQTLDVYGEGKPTVLELIDLQTFKVVKTGSLKAYSHVIDVVTNDNGTMIVCCKCGENVEAFLLDMNLKVIKSVLIRKGTILANNSVIGIGGNGFCEIERTDVGNHRNAMYHIRRYDRNLNLIWESDVEANFIYYFQSEGGNIWAYKSMFEPERECYIASYGQEPSLPAIKSNVYTISEDYISKIAVGTTAVQLLEKIPDASLKIVHNGAELSGNKVLATGMTVQLIVNQRVVREYQIIITGDTNGDGKITVTDFVQMQAHLLNKTPLQGAAAKAADTSGDGKISVTDYVQIQAHILGKSTVQPRSV